MFLLGSFSSSTLAHSRTRCRPYKCVRESAFMAARASFPVRYSTKANPRWLPSNFFGNRTFLSWPKVPKSFKISFRVAWKGTFRTIIFVGVFFPAGAAFFFVRDVDFWDEIASCNECPSTSLPWIIFIAFFANSCDESSTNPYPIDRERFPGIGESPFVGATFRGMRTERMFLPTCFSKISCRVSSVVAKLRFLRYKVADISSLSASLSTVSSGSMVLSKLFLF
mmetsp:Transcript_25991/g.53389  ORF Transcript_25991/g.53389 Transcript_25991/m.53389 type:complete len:224 (-) Transcript_25991:932-1603(-)